ncbi:MAG: heavy-metal-associated domain-containing protein [Anaerolineae bacterium]|jgi:copper chaperone CopZ|nr:heavy-metal-associated domain-containing protein [Anaerolineae bacterium]
MERKTVQVPNIGCDGCVRTIQNEISEIAGVKAVQGNKDTKQITVEWDAPANWQVIVQKLSEIDYAPAEAQ